MKTVNLLYYPSVTKDLINIFKYIYRYTIARRHIEYNLTYEGLFTPHICAYYVHYANPTMQFDVFQLQYIFYTNYPSGIREFTRRGECTYLNRVWIDYGAALSVLLLKFRLVRLEHADLAPSIEKQSDGSHPQDQDKNDDQGLFSSHHYRACSCNPWLNPVSFFTTKCIKNLYN